MRALIALAVPALAGLVLMTPSAAAPLSLARPGIAPAGTQVQYGYGERREEYSERRDYDRDRWRDDRRQWGDGDRDDWRRRERRRAFCRMHPEACGRY
jgi:hypothetical protein